MQLDGDMTSLAETMLACLPLGVALYDAQTLCLLKANAAFLSSLDTFLAPSWHAGYAIGHPLTEWGYQPQIARVAKIFRTVVEMGTSYQVEGDRFLASGTHKSSWNWTLAPIRDSDGRIVQLLQTLCDARSPVSSTAIEDERVRLHAILDQLPEGVLITDVSTGSISYANAAAADILGISLLNLIGTPLHRHLKPLMKERLSMSSTSNPGNSPSSEPSIERPSQARKHSLRDQMAARLSR